MKLKTLKDIFKEDKNYEATAYLAEDIHKKLKAEAIKWVKFTLDEPFFDTFCDYYRDLDENWDTYGGLGASERAVQFSVGLLEWLRVLPEISPPRVSPISTGVYLEWRAGDRLSAPFHRMA